MQKKLIAELGKFASRLYDVRVALYGPEVAAELIEILSRHEAEQGEGKPTEPLEELAKRKDKSVSVCVVICDNELFQEAEFGGERAARAYLEGLADKEGV